MAISPSGGPIYPSLSVDASCIGNLGRLEFRGVWNEDGRILFTRGPYAYGTNNIGEFLALVLGLAYIQQHQLQCPIYTDSITALSWVKKKKCRTMLQTDDNELTLLIRKAELWLHNNIWTTSILKWQTHLWGEIPADYNRK